MPSLWPLRRDVAERPLADQRFSNPSLPNVTSPIGKGLGGNTTTLPLAVDTKPIDFGPILNSDVGPGPLIDYRQGLIRNLTTVVTRALPFFTPAASVDWRHRYGGSWLATIQDQGPCGNCWSFAATALTETMIRIEHNVWSKRSEADLRDNWGLSCAHGANVNDALDWAINHGGISDLDCVPWHFDDDNFYPCPDRSGRLGRLPQKTYLGSIDDQKKWLDTVGPIVASFTVYYDFFGWTGPDPYKYDGTSAVDGGHVVLLVGYDDSKSCWIARNSWGSGWGEQGYFLISYGTADIDTWAKTGLSNLDPDPWSKRRLHNGNLVQSGNGPTHRNFELAVGSSPVRTAYRQGEAPLAWHAAYSIEDDGDLSADGLHPGFNCMGQPALTETSYNRDLDMVYWERGGYMRRWYFSQSAQQWQNTGRVGDGHTAGYPSYIESAGGGFEIVVRSDSGTLDHWYRRPDSAWDWFFGGSIASDIMQSGPTLVQGNVGIAGNLYVVAVLPSGQMQLFWRDSDAPGKPWHAGEIFGSGVGNTPPVMVQGTFGTTDEKTPGNFELVVVVNGQAEHWWRANADLASNPPHAGCEGGWKKSATFGSGLRHAWGLVHGAYGDNLELIVEESSGKLAHWYRVGTGAWYESTEINV